MKTLRAIWDLLAPRQRWLFLGLIGVNILATVAEVLGVFSVLPFLALAGDPSLARTQPTLRKAFEFFGFSDDLSFVVAAGVVTIIAILFTNAINMASLWYRTSFCMDVLSELSGRLFRGFLSRPYPFFLQRNTAVLGKELLNETQNFYTYALEPVTIMFARGLQVAAVAIALVVFDWRTALLAALLFGGFYGAASWLLHARICRYGTMRYQANERRFRIAAEALAGVKELQLFGREQWYANAFDNESRALAVSGNRLNIFAMTPRFVVEVLVFTALIVAVLVKLLSGESFQDLAPALGVFAVAGLRMLPSVQLLYQYSTLLSASYLTLTQITKLFQDVDALHATPSLPAAVKEPLRLVRELAIDQVTFRYQQAERTVLDSIALAVPAGACIGICGPSGSGKTTLMDICLGLLEPEAGQVLIDGAPLTVTNRSAWQRNIGYVPQSIYLIDGTIADNIAFATDPQSLDREAVIRAAKLAHLHDFIEGTEHGYDTEVGERGVRLSGGQRQRVAIARALYRNPDVLFFDEATSALDNESESLVVEAVQSLAHTKTIIIVAHRLSTLRYCDIIYELRKGRIVKTGSYEAVAAQATAHA
jgi:ABC-type multidrug transport system fused ATPase/permease subunit